VRIRTSPAGRDGRHRYSTAGAGDPARWRDRRSNSCIDRGAWDDTVVGENTIESIIWSRSRTTSASGAAARWRPTRAFLEAQWRRRGSSSAAAPGVADHVTIGDGARIAGRGRGHARRAGGRDVGGQSSSAGAAMDAANSMGGQGQPFAGGRTTMNTKSDDPATSVSIDIGRDHAADFPHRYPFLLGRSGRGIPRSSVRSFGVKCVTINELFFRAMFPALSRFMPGGADCRSHRADRRGLFDVQSRYDADCDG